MKFKNFQVIDDGGSFYVLKRCAGVLWFNYDPFQNSYCFGRRYLDYGQYNLVSYLLEKYSEPKNN